MKVSDALHLRGQIYSFLKDGAKAEADLKAATQHAPNDSAIWLTLGDNYVNNLADDEQALAAYRRAFAITGKGNGWQPQIGGVPVQHIIHLHSPVGRSSVIVDCLQVKGQL